MAVFADTGEYDGKPGKLVAPCFVIRHPKGTLLWDNGLCDSFVEHAGGVDNGDFHLTVDKLLKDQLALIGMTTADMNYVAFSHFHFDHTGNANQFAAATAPTHSLRSIASSGSSKTRMRALLSSTTLPISQRCRNRRRLWSSRNVERSANNLYADQH
jgi:hypothetical protein